MRFYLKKCFFLFKDSYFCRARKITRLVQCLHASMSLGVAEKTCKASAGDWKTGRAPASQPWLVELQTNERLYLTKPTKPNQTNIQKLIHSAWGMVPRIIPWPSHICTHACTHTSYTCASTATHIHTQKNLAYRPLISDLIKSLCQFQRTLHIDEQEALHLQSQNI